MWHYHIHGTEIIHTKYILYCSFRFLMFNNTCFWRTILNRQKINGLIWWFPAFQLETNKWGHQYFFNIIPVSSDLASTSWTISWYWFTYQVYTIMLKLFGREQPVIHKVLISCVTHTAKIEFNVMNMFLGLLASGSYCPFNCLVTEAICILLYVIKKFLQIVVRSFREMHILQSKLPVHDYIIYFIIC